MADDSLLLKELRLRAGWPGELNDLAEKADRMGRLEEALRQVAEASFRDAQGSSGSSNTIVAGRVPLYFSERSNWDATFYSRLKQVLIKVTGSTERFDPFGEG
jgi:hypothetical protein